MLDISWYALELFCRNPAQYAESLNTPESEDSDDDGGHDHACARALACSVTGEPVVVDSLNYDNRKTKAYAEEVAASRRAGHIPLLKREADSIIELAPMLSKLLGPVGALQKYSAEVLPGVTASAQCYPLERANVFFRVVDDVSSFPSTLWAARYDRLASWTALASKRTYLPSVFAVMDRRSPARAAVYELAPDELHTSATECLALAYRLRKAHETQTWLRACLHPIPLTRPSWMSLDAGVVQDGHQLWR